MRDFLLFCVSLRVVSPNTEVVFSMNEDNTNTCKEKNKKQLKEVEDAQLAAHRYYQYFVNYYSGQW